MKKKRTTILRVQRSSLLLHYQHRLNPSWTTSQQIHWPLLHT